MELVDRSSLERKADVVFDSSLEKGWHGSEVSLGAVKEIGRLLLVL
jgi:hypothetical protein